MLTRLPEIVFLLSNVITISSWHASVPERDVNIILRDGKYKPLSWFNFIFSKSQYLIFTDLDVLTFKKIVAIYVNVLKSIFTGSCLNVIDTGFGKNENFMWKSYNLYTNITGN